MKTLLVFGGLPHELAALVQMLAEATGVCDRLYDIYFLYIALVYGS